MKTKLILWAFIALFFVGCSLGLFLYFYKTFTQQKFTIKHIIEAPIASSPKESQKNWFDRITTFNTSYTYPSKEFDVMIDFIDPNTKYIPEKLLISAIDKYKFACINEFLKSQNINFAYSKNHNSVDIIIYLPKEYAQSKSLIHNLNYYDIDFAYQ